MTRAELDALAYRASLAGKHALAGLLQTFADRADDPRTAAFVLTAIEGEGLA